MNEQEPVQGIYAGIWYIVVVRENGKKYIGLTAEVAISCMTAGANMKLLDDIGDQDPDEVMAAFVETFPMNDE